MWKRLSVTSTDSTSVPFGEIPPNVSPAADIGSMQIAAIEFARNVVGYADATSREFDPTSQHKVIDIMEDQFAQ